MGTRRQEWCAWIMKGGRRVLIGRCVGRTEAEALRDVRRTLGGTLSDRTIHVEPSSAELSERPYDELCAERNRLREERNRLRAERDALLAALRPFAQCWKPYLSSYDSRGTPGWSAMGTVRIADLERAHELCGKPEGSSGAGAGPVGRLYRHTPKGIRRGNSEDRLYAVCGEEDGLLVAWKCTLLPNGRVWHPAYPAEEIKADDPRLFAPSSGAGRPVPTAHFIPDSLYELVI